MESNAQTQPDAGSNDHGAAVDKSTNPKVQAAHSDGEQLPSNQQKDPSDWVTGDEPMTGAQASYLKTLCEEAKTAFDAKLNKAQASERIDALRKETGKDTASH